MKASGIKLRNLITYVVMEQISQSETEILIHQTEQNRENSLLSELDGSILLLL